VVKQLTGLTASGTFSLTAAEQDVIYKFIPNATSIALGVRIITYNGNTNVGTKDYTINALVGGGIVPTFTNITHTEAVTAVKNNVGAYVQQMSKLQIAITGGAGVKFSTIKSYKITVDDQVLNAVSGTTQAIQRAGTVPIVATITDSRGRIASKTLNITVLAYTFPKFI